MRNSRITGNVASAGSARALLFQALQAFDSTHTDSFGKDVKVERIYIITPYAISPAAISSIKATLREHSGQVVFIDGPTLFDLFKRYWPDFLPSEANIFENRFNQLNKRPRKGRDKLDVFLSYAAQDTLEARIIFEKLRSKSISAFLAEKSIKAGEIWEDRIKEALSAYSGDCEQ